MYKDGYNIGRIAVTCNLSNQMISLQCYDHGEYPWGRHKTQGAMAILCKKLKVNDSASNTCLPTHIIISLLTNKLVTINELVTKYKTFTKHLLSSSHMREDGPTINAILKKFNLMKRICIRRIFTPSAGSFVLTNHFFGVYGKPQIFLIHRRNHFFLGLQC